ncbi:uncharacterized protein LOC141863622 isoform X1 [Acropora palmata]|uniref:uncharacterized protein LOC141863622 isoform X1 n=1 Tax=Acropora palmata TaxID=6131 RepID=UPI003DA18A67
MNSEKPKKMVTTWWDLVDHYLLAVMFAVSVASVVLQATLDRLICIPAVNCSDLARNDSVVPRWSERSSMLDTCNRSSSFVFLTTMSDRRQYDYFDNECYEKMDWFSAHYSLIFLAETVILLAISYFWLKCPDCVNALAHCEHLLPQFITGEFSFRDEKRQEIMKRLRIFQAGYSQKITKFKLSSFTWQYRLRGVVGLIATIAAILLNAIYYSLSTGWTQCHLDGLAAVSVTYRFFQCTRSMERYFHVGSILVISLLSLHLILVLGSFLWSVTGERREPTYEMSPPIQGTFQFEGDAAFLFHFILNSNYGHFVRYMYEDEKQRRKKDEPIQQGETATLLEPEG